MPSPAIALISSLETRVMMARLLLGGLIGLCAGALAGGLAFAALPADTTATAFLRLQDPADLTAIAGGANQVTPDNQDNTATFVAGEIAYITGDGFGQAVARKMAMDEPAELMVAQASESPVVTISYSSASRDDAIRTVQAAIDLYRQQLEQRVDAELRTILPALAQWQRDDADPVRRQEIQRIRESVELQAVQASSLLVVQPPTPNRASSQRWLIGAILGALVGGAGAVAVLLARRRRSGHGSVVKTLTGTVDRVLLPAVDLDLPARDAWTEDHTRLARTLYAQCPGTGPDRVILVLGASSSSGAPEVAALLQAAAAESGPVAATLSGMHAAPSTVDATAARVVDGGTVGDATLTPELMGAAATVVLVARIEVDTIPQVLMLRSATAAATSTAAVFTYRRQPTATLRKPRPLRRAQ
ncbi:hypothetical protein [Mycolicibacterium austroafricanum]|uniref:hypothetical protein n=1 Tax=Mycolicibacterium austroafricanum TaxID=39687 RepID=UPI001CA337C9|nr:hypothetical protein [Mycolicibacterium austroafricanum]QZT63664.1 hypothetical protein JN085_04590 [Mycolicibacterium austroafricanum]